MRNLIKVMFSEVLEYYLGRMYTQTLTVIVFVTTLLLMCDSPTIVISTFPLKIVGTIGK